MTYASADRGLRPNADYEVSSTTLWRAADDHLDLSAIGRRLIDLEAAFFDETGHSLDVESRDGFRVFMQYAPWLKKPSIAADSDGKIVATWERGDECLSLRFYRYKIDFAMSGGELPRQWGNTYTLYFLSEHPAARSIAAR